MLEDIRLGRVQVSVVYKIDRLTRSLTDFAKTVEIFDAHKVTFVSVTQQFNTTTSMGRLTLNVLLSFAQYEREITGERIRDKFAVSKAKGMFMGGNVPVGYKLGDRELFIDEIYAQVITQIFEAYLKLGSASKVKSYLQELGIRTPPREHRNGKTSGDKHLTQDIFIKSIPIPFISERSAIMEKYLMDSMKQFSTKIFGTKSKTNLQKMLHARKALLLSASYDTHSLERYFPLLDTD